MKGLKDVGLSYYGSPTFVITWRLIGVFFRDAYKTKTSKSHLNNVHWDKIIYNLVQIYG